MTASPSSSLEESSVQARTSAQVAAEALGGAGGGADAVLQAPMTRRVASSRLVMKGGIWPRFATAGKNDA
jgi:hypothetical protein